jgi:hypothetical protein
MVVIAVLENNLRYITAMGLSLIPEFESKEVREVQGRVSLRLQVVAKPRDALRCPARPATLNRHSTRLKLGLRFPFLS